MPAYTLATKKSGYRWAAVVRVSFCQKPPNEWASDLTSLGTYRDDVDCV